MRAGNSGGVVPVSTGTPDSGILRAIFTHMSQASGIMTGLWLLAVAFSFALARFGGGLDILGRRLRSTRGRRPSRTIHTQDILEKGPPMFPEQRDNCKA